MTEQASVHFARGSFVCLPGPEPRAKGFVNGNMVSSTVEVWGVTPEGDLVSRGEFDRADVHLITLVPTSLRAARDWAVNSEFPPYPVRIGDYVQEWARVPPSASVSWKGGRPVYAGYNEPARVGLVLCNDPQALDRAIVRWWERGSETWVRYLEKSVCMRELCCIPYPTIPFTVLEAMETAVRGIRVPSSSEGKRARVL